jgi:hypothetical protein
VPVDVSISEPVPAPLIDRVALEQALRGDVSAVKAFREALKTAGEQLGERFRRNEIIETLVEARAHVIDEVILACWKQFAAGALDAADLVAVVFFVALIALGDRAWARASSSCPA